MPLIFNLSDCIEVPPVELSWQVGKIEKLDFVSFNLGSYFQLWVSKGRLEFGRRHISELVSFESDIAMRVNNIVIVDEIKVSLKN